MQYKNFEIKWLGHSGFLIIFNGINVYIDPFKLEGSYRGEECKADLILITHSHYDHCSVEDIKKILKSDTKIIGPADIISQTRQIKDGIDLKISQPGKTLDYKGIRIKSIPAYNINKPFHPKEEAWLGYIINFDGTLVYHTGDSDLIPEMKNIQTNIALLPVSGKFVMNVSEAAKAAEIIKPDLAIPMHWGEIIGNRNDAEIFIKLCQDNGISAIILEKEA